RRETIENAVAAARSAGDSGDREIALTGPNPGDFGVRNGRRADRFTDPMRARDAADNVTPVRISSIEPNLLTDGVLDFVAGSDRFAPHFHIPLQSGSNKILRLMRRRYLRELYADRVQRIKALIPHCCIGVDVIVGFPGESEADFLDTYRFINDLDVSYLHVFPYSERANTPAAEMTAVVPRSERARRSEMLHILADKKRRKFYVYNLRLDDDG